MTKKINWILCAEPSDDGYLPFYVPNKETFDKLTALYDFCFNAGEYTAGEYTAKHFIFNVDVKHHTQCVHTSVNVDTGQNEDLDDEYFWADEDTSVIDSVMKIDLKKVTSMYNKANKISDTYDHDQFYDI